MGIKVSIIVPVYNESATIKELLTRIHAFSLDTIEKEIICVDDASNDGTGEILTAEAGKTDTYIVRHTRNQGKGAAIRSGLQHAKGDIIIIQDADLEYDPADYAHLLKPILRGNAQVVYGSRLLGWPQATSRGHLWGNRFLTSMTNLLFGAHLTDMETGYKIFTAEVKAGLKLTAPRWGFDPEITAQILSMGYPIHEVPISYAPRKPQAGKKIRWRDGFVVLYTLFRHRFH
ncbi:MAG: glycosyltransferase family 2 protein [Chloroflexi bacterium]|nr:glycosyltransferase family 2 protein [Chloroflexota bacterium]